MHMESQVAYEQDGTPPSGPVPIMFDVAPPGPGVSPAQWVRSACSQQVQRERLLESPDHQAIGQHGDSEDEHWQRMDRIKRKFALCLFALAAGFVLVIVMLILIGFKRPWGKPAYNQGLVNLMEQYSKTNITISSACMYKQHNNGAWWSDKRFFGMVGRQRDGKGGSPDILYYHHQGNLLELSDLHNNTRWMQISMNRNGVGFRIDTVPQVIDVIRYTKECYYWCGTLTRQKRDPAKFAEFLRRHHEPYNGFLLNCLQFSERIWQYFDAADQGCAPAHLVNQQQFVQESFPKFKDDPVNVIGPPE